MTTIEKLQALAANMWWSWNPEVLDLFDRLAPDAFRAANHNPHAALRAAGDTVPSDESFTRAVDAAYAALRSYLDSPGRFGDAPRTSYFCMEYGLHESFPSYSGGLGILAGDHAKAASDLGLPFTAIGLFLREGYFEQHFAEGGWQQETYPVVEPESHALTLVTGSGDGAPLTVRIHLGTTELHLQAWRIDLGRTTLYLLDSDRPDNPEHLRGLTRRLYQGDRATRLQQEIILGVGGVRLLRALGVETDVYHMNEGHCALLTFELLRERMAAGDTRADAEAWVRDHCVFTTHTPVLAGHDRFDPYLFNEQTTVLRDELGLTEYDLLSYGRVNPDDFQESFTMTVLGLKLSRRANGVSKLNGEVARAQWHSLYPDRPIEEVPIGSITNGIHLPTWTVSTGRAFFDRALGDWMQHRMDPAFWLRLEEVPDEELWAYRSALRARLVEFVRRRLPRQSIPQRAFLNPDALTIGFARRFATYKRAPLLFSDIDQAAELFGQPDRPVQILYAGKAHPADEGGKRFIQQIYEMTQHPAFRGKVVFLENYNMAVGRMLVSGCDVWLNNPRRPMEASGTSGQKVAVHGGLNLSILDGWWPEGYNGRNGWAIGHDASAEIRDAHHQDAEDAQFLYETLRHQVIPEFYDRDAAGLPHRWIARMRNAMQTLAYAFSAERMVTDYIEQVYQTAPVDR